MHVHSTCSNLSFFLLFSLSLSLSYAVDDYGVDDYDIIKIGFETTALPLDNSKIKSLQLCMHNTLRLRLN